MADHKKQESIIAPQFEKKFEKAALPIDELKKTSLSLHDLNKAKEKEEAAREAMRSRCSTCFREIYPIRLCSGHDKKGGKGGSGSGGSGTKTSANDISGIASATNIDGLPVGNSALNTILQFDNIDRSDNSATIDSKFNPEIIEYLIKMNVLSVESKIDTESMLGTLAIRVLVQPSDPEQKRELENYLQTILHELKEFKKSHGIRANEFEPQINKSDEGNIKSINIVLPAKLYCEFMKHLENNLVPTPKITQREKIDHKKSPHLRSTQFTPRPNLDKKKKELDDKSKHHKKPKSPFALPSVSDTPELKQK